MKVFLSTNQVYPCNDQHLFKYFCAMPSIEDMNNVWPIDLAKIFTEKNKCTYQIKFYFFLHFLKNYTIMA